MRSDRHRRFRKTKEIIKTALQNIELPAKIYIDAHGEPGSDCIAQNYSWCGLKVDTDISSQKLSEIFLHALPFEHMRQKISFHFVVCNGNYFAKNFMDYISKAGFKNCYSISYDNTVYVTSYPAADNHFEIEDFSTIERCAPDDHYLHHSEKPALPDNKKISLWDGSKAIQTGYRDWVNASSQRLPASQRKNFWIYDRDDFITLCALKQFILDETLRCKHQQSRVYKTLCSLFEACEKMEAQILSYAPNVIINFINNVKINLDRLFIHHEYSFFPANTHYFSTDRYNSMLDKTGLSQINCPQGLIRVFDSEQFIEKSISGKSVFLT
ncbi:MAG: hypothetical protein GY750_19455 [Lentisphaerae bacterium]|nr:hypothetical protein [Lentisphaerota bacterium]